MVMTKQDFDDFVHESIKTFEASVEKIYNDALEFHAKGCDSPEDEKEDCAKEFMIVFYKAVHRHLAVKAGMPIFSVQKLN